MSSLAQISFISFIEVLEGVLNPSNKGSIAQEESVISEKNTKKKRYFILFALESVSM